MGKIPLLCPLRSRGMGGFSLTYTFGASRYHITLQRGGQASPPIELRDDSADYEICYTFA